MALPLEGYLMLDLSRLVPGPIATWMLADLGMDVLKVEEMAVARAGRARDSFSPTVDDPELEARHMAWNFVARNKRSIPINLATPEGQEIFHKLAARADVIFESYRRGVTKGLGADYDTVKKINPRIVYCSLTGYGQQGAYADWPGQELNAQGMSGVNALTSDPAGNPADMYFPVVDTFAAACVVIAIQAALMARERTGRGQSIDISITESGLALINQVTVGYLRDGYAPRRGVPNLHYLRCKDGKYLTNASIAEFHFWNRFCEAIGRPQYKNMFPLPPEKRATASEDAALMAAIRDVRAVMLTKTRDEWLTIIPLDISVVPMLELDEALTGGYAQDRGVLWEMEHPLAGKVRQLGSPFRLAETPPTFRRFAPMLGENTVEVLKGLGYADADIQRLEKGGVVRVSHWSPPQKQKRKG